ncbi:hypothetical protein BX666DRAFT_1987349 [Dichotomocladium elegans]|nr:hypothetical protein BX666DRAFT_1987349 [Dichotomocladium elegans]
MQLTLDSLQSLLTDLTLFIHLFLGAVGLLIVLLAAHVFPFHHDYSILSGAVSVGRSCTRYLRPHKLLLRNGIWSSSDGETEISTRPADSFCLCDGGTHVSGLVNTGNSCYINSVLQVLSSLPRLHSYLNLQQRRDPASRPVTSSLAKTLRLLTCPLPKRIAFRPTDIVSAMNNRRISGHDQQDAQELFQLITSAIDVEQRGMTLQSNGLRDIIYSISHNPSSSSRHAFSSLLSFNASRRLENPFTGLLANRLSCMQCGYTEAIRHFSFNNVQLTLPDRRAATLDECLQEFTAMEYLSDATCRKCTIIDTVSDMAAHIDGLREQAKRASSRQERRKILTEMVAMETRRRDLEHRLNTGTFSEESSNTRSVSRMSCKQAMFAKPPEILCLHLSRSTFHPSGAVLKNGCQISFPEYLDIGPYCTNGTLNTQPHLPISSPSISTMNSTTSPESEMVKTQYRLMGVIVHYGSHDFGHFASFKRRLAAEGCDCRHCRNDKVVFHGSETWYRISDEQTDICTIDEVLQSNPYMLLYEQIAGEDENPHPTIPDQFSRKDTTLKALPSGALSTKPAMPSSPQTQPILGTCLKRRSIERWNDRRRPSTHVISV